VLLCHCSCSSACCCCYCNCCCLATGRRTADEADEALDGLLFQPSRRSGQIWSGCAGADLLQAVQGKPRAADGRPALQLLCCTYHLPPACDPVLTAVLRSGAGQHRVGAAELAMLRQCASEYVEGYRAKDPAFQDMNTAKVAIRRPAP